MKTDNILSLIQNELSLVMENLKEVAVVDSPQCSKLFHHILSNTGKGVRPAITLLCAKFYDYNPDLVISMATGIELLHIATLVHDDIVDDSPLRRGVLSTNKLWNSNLAMLAGDYLFAKAGEFVCATGNLAVIKLFTQTLMKVSLGELCEIMSAYDPERSRNDYFFIISAKTASLFMLAAEAAAVLNGASERKTEALRDYGYNLGMAFQIKDDILDFISSQEKIGKPVKKDLPSGNLTLPAILFLEQYPESFIKDALREKDKESLHQAVDIISNSQAIEKSQEIAKNFIKCACEKIKIFPPNAIRKALIELAESINEKD